MAVEIKRCGNCQKTLAADYQDKIYGDKMRVMNESMKKEYTCTVCGAKHK
jgi:uncharacterized protein with PIN domain